MCCMYQRWEIISIILSFECFFLKRLKYLKKTFLIYGKKPIVAFILISVAFYRYNFGFRMSTCWTAITQILGSLGDGHSSLNHAESLFMSSVALFPHPRGLLTVWVVEQGDNATNTGNERERKEFRRSRKQGAMDKPLFMFKRTGSSVNGMIGECIYSYWGE